MNKINTKNPSPKGLNTITSITTPGVNKMKIPKSFIEYIEKNCAIDEIDGALICVKCRQSVHIDWFEKDIECTGCDNL